MSWDSLVGRVCSYYGKYKKSLFSKEQKIELFIYNDYIEGRGFKIIDNELVESIYSFRYDFQDILEVKLSSYNGTQAIFITAYNSSIAMKKSNSTTILPNIENYEDAIEKIKSVQNEYLEEENRKKIALEEAEKKMALLRQEQEKFFNDCYNFHLNNGRPRYIFKHEDLDCVVLYLNDSKDLNFLFIDGRNKLENNGIIEYSKIHYYEKAGSIHYTTDVNAHYSSFAGSFTSEFFSRATTYGPNYLYGPMGLIQGDLLFHSNSQLVTSNVDFKITSKINKIDDRNVILNYYSDVQKQFIDLELPADIYNFFSNLSS